MFDDQLMLKIFRKLQPAISPELEIGRFLTEVSPFPHVAALLGAVELEREDGSGTTLAIRQRQIANQRSCPRMIVKKGFPKGLLDQTHLERLVRDGEKSADDQFLAGYLEGFGRRSRLAGGQKEFRRLLRFFLLEKVIYEVGYELRQRPDWIDLPLSGFLELLNPVSERS